MVDRAKAARLPADVAAYRATDWFDKSTVPDGLTRWHSTKPGVWGVLELRRGTLVYRLESGPEPSQKLMAGEEIIIEPDTRHRLEKIDEDASFRVRFFR